MRFITTMAAVAVAVCLSSVAAADDIYISFSDLGDTPGAAASEFSAEFDLADGNTGSAFVWLAEGQNYTGLFLDAFSSDTNVVALTGFEVFNPEITVFGNPSGDLRWEASAVAGNDSIVPAVDGSAIEGFRGFAVQEAGIDNANDGTLFLDEGFEAGSGFVFARLDFQLIGVGSADLTSAGSINFGNGASIVGDADGIGGADVTLSPRFAGASINVVDTSAIPEPTSALLLGMGLIGLVSRRRR